MQAIKCSLWLKAPVERRAIKDKGTSAFLGKFPIKEQREERMNLGKLPLLENRKSSASYLMSEPSRLFSPSRQLSISPNESRRVSAGRWVQRNSCHSLFYILHSTLAWFYLWNHSISALWLREPSEPFYCADVILHIFQLERNWGTFQFRLQTVGTSSPPYDCLTTDLQPSTTHATQCFSGLCPSQCLTDLYSLFKLTFETVDNLMFIFSGLRTGICLTAV